VKQSFLSHKEVIIRDHATIRAYQSNDTECLDIQSNPLEICLFCTKKGRIELDVSFIPHSLELGASEAIFLAYPKGSWQMKIHTEPGTEFYMMQMEVATLHKIINPSFDTNHLESAHKVNMRDLMRLIPVNPSLMMCFEQLLHHKLAVPFRQIFEKAKFLEIFSLLMESSFGQPMEACPVVMSPAIEEKLQQVRRHIIEHLDEAPNPDELSVMYELPRNTLREGYRYVYGKTIHQYHTDHKLESAMQMLTQGELLVKEVAFKIGYQNPSHFISAFKKKFGYTPKQYLKREALQPV
jgi:AraC-like DNA-binding protein